METDCSPSAWVVTTSISQPHHLRRANKHALWYALDLPHAYLQPPPRGPKRHRRAALPYPPPLLLCEHRLARSAVPACQPLCQRQALYAPARQSCVHCNRNAMRPPTPLHASSALRHRVRLKYLNDFWREFVPGMRRSALHRLCVGPRRVSSELPSVQSR